MKLWLYQVTHSLQQVRKTVDEERNEMSIKKGVLLVVGMLAAIALAAPVSATATEYRVYDSKETTTISKLTEIPLTGKLKFKYMGTGMECEVTATLATETGASANTKVSKFEIKTGTCAGFGSLYEGCEATKDTITGLSWPADVNEKDLAITNVEIDEKNKAKAGKECLPTTTNLNFSPLTATPATTTGIKTITLSGEGVAETNVGNLAIAAEGTLEPTGGASATYGIEKKGELNKKLKDVTTGETVAQGTIISLQGHAKFETLGTGIECTTINSEIEIEAGETGRVLSYVPVTSSCTGFGTIYKGCKVKSSVTTNTPFSALFTENDIDVTSEIEMHSELEKCENTKVTFTDLYFEAATLKPENTKGETAKKGEATSGFEIVETEGEAVNNLGTLAVSAFGTFEILGSAKCTYAFE